ncbi:V-set and immunoglobulin domain-containing protein 10 [Erythrolamprus reginae]|uniref:V-set and immunoglobulin domain-containing protein 10 n=1 Tax=Erythrolamprus reginae TaxID=121349 RepID=UPI00396C5053
MASEAAACVLLVLLALPGRGGASGGPDRMEVSISPTGTLPNGTLYAKSQDVLTFNCSSDTRPDSATKWDFHPLGSARETFTEVNGSQSYFVLKNITPSYQGNYSCLASNLLSQRQTSVIRELLIYYPPASSPKCWAEASMKNSQEVQLSCSWPGGYPSPSLQWINPEDLLINSNTTHFANATVMSLQGSRQLWGKDFTCRGSHVVDEKDKQNCTLRLERPSVMSNPMKTCFVGRSVEMTCELTAGNPLARITWLRNLSKVEVEIRSGGRFLVSQKEGISTLVIQNCSANRDQGYYLCKAENPLGLREVYVHLKVTEPMNVAGIVGSVVVLLLLGVLVFSGILLYAGPQLCLKVNILGNRDASDILELMDSEDEDIYLESTSEPTLDQGERIGNGYSTRCTESSFPETFISLEEIQRSGPAS